LSVSCAFFVRRSARSKYQDGEVLQWLMLDNVPAATPCWHLRLKREGEDPTRMFAGEGDAFRTNTRFCCQRRYWPPNGCPLGI
jgi:methylmalonyl-CoA mutase